jgi:hypothetical protein
MRGCNQAAYECFEVRIAAMRWERVGADHDAAGIVDTVSRDWEKNSAGEAVWFS